MSLILNALRKSEQERQSIQAKSLGTDLYEIPQKNNRRKIVIYSAIFIIANLILTWVVISFTRKPEVLPKLEIKPNTESAIQNQIVTPNTGDSIADLMAEKSHSSKEQPAPKNVVVKPERLNIPQQNHINTSVPKTNDSEKPTVVVKPLKSSEPLTTDTVTAKPEIVNTQPVETKTEDKPETLDFEKPTDLTTLKQIEEIMEENRN